MPVPFCGCWLWLCGVGSHGYGSSHIPGQNRSRGNGVAHRVSYAAFKGEIPAGMLVQHSCDIKICVNPDHLSLGTDKTNSDDKIRKGRANLDGRVFPPHPGRKFTAEQIAEIIIAPGTLKEIGARFGCNAAAIRNIRIGRN